MKLLPNGVGSNSLALPSLPRYFINEYGLLPRGATSLPLLSLL